MIRDDAAPSAPLARRSVARGLRADLYAQLAADGPTGAALARYHSRATAIHSLDRSESAALALTVAGRLVRDDSATATADCGFVSF